jgi:hypothetical protein
MPLIMADLLILRPSAPATQPRPSQHRHVPAGSRLITALIPGLALAIFLLVLGLAASSASTLVGGTLIAFAAALTGRTAWGAVRAKRRVVRARPALRLIPGGRAGGHRAA